MGFYRADEGTVRLNGKEINISNPKDARANGIGMVYQHFTLVPSLTAAENLVINRADAPAVINWSAEKRRLEEFLDKMPFRVPLNTPISSLAAGEKQKLEILKLLYLDQRFMILDEPTSVLTPSRGRRDPGAAKQMALAKDITVVIITHKFREVTAFADAVTVLRRGKQIGGGKVGELTTQDMARMMIGDTPIRETAKRKENPHDKVVLDLSGLYAEDTEGLPAIDALNLTVHAGEIVGIAGVSGNGQSELVEVLSGQRPLDDGGIFIRGERFEPTRENYAKFKVFGLPEEPLKNATVPRMTVAENMAFRTYDRPPLSMGWWLSPGPMREKARELIKAYRVKTPSPESADRDPVGRQRAARRAGARAVERRRRADRRQPLLRARLRLGGRDPRPDHGAAQPRRRRAAGVGGPGRDPRAGRPRRRHVGRQDQLRLARVDDRPPHHRPAHGGALTPCGLPKSFSAPVSDVSKVGTDPPDDWRGDAAAAIRRPGGGRCA